MERLSLDLMWTKAVTVKPGDPKRCPETVDFSPGDEMPGIVGA